jgi:hypothetical protein
LTYFFRPQCGPGVDSAFNRNEHQKYFLEGKGGRCVGLTILPPSCADCLEIWKPQPPGTLRACPYLYEDCYTFYRCTDVGGCIMCCLAPPCGRLEITWVSYSHIFLLHVSLVLRPARLHLVCLSAPCQCTPILNLRPVICVLTPFVWLRSGTLTPIYSIV